VDASVASESVEEPAVPFEAWVGGGPGGGGGSAELVDPVASVCEEEEEDSLPDGPLPRVCCNCESRPSSSAVSDDGDVEGVLELVPELLSVVPV